MKKIPLLLIILLLPAVAAFNVDIQPKSNNIYRNETATFALQLTNSNGFNDTFSISTRDPSFLVDVKPSISTIPAFSTKTYTIHVTPKQSVKTGPLAVPIKIESSETSKFITKNLLLNIKDPNAFSGQYAPVVDLTVSVPDIVDPRNNVPVTIKMKNKNPRKMPNLTLKILSSIQNRIFTINMPPLGSRQKQVLLKTPRDQPPGIYNVKIQVIEANTTVSQATKEFEIKGYRDIQTQMEKTSNFFATTKTYTFTNKGNVKTQITKEIPVPWYNYPFTSFDKPSPTNTWKESLKPGETFSLTVTRNYRSLVLIVILLIFAIAGYYLFRSPITVTKTAGLVNDEEGQMKVRLEIKNRGNETMDNVIVLDKVPNMADFVKKEEPGTLTPDKVVTSEAKGTSLKWKLDTLEPDEERIIQYTIKSKLQVVGGLKLPPSKVKFHHKDKQRSSLSNSATVVEQ